MTGIVYTYQCSLPGAGIANPGATQNLGFSYFAVSLALNILLTTMIVTRLILHKRTIRNTMGGSAGVGQLYGAVITILVESSALYAVSFLLFFVPWAARSWVDNAFWPILLEVQVCAAFFYPFLHCNPGMSSNRGDKQVIAPFLIIRRVADRRALTNEAIVPRDPGPIRFRSLESTGGDETLADGNPTGSTDVYGYIPCEFGAGVEITIEKFTS